MLCRRVAGLCLLATVLVSARGATLAAQPAGPPPPIDDESPEATMDVFDLLQLWRRGDAPPPEEPEWDHTKPMLAIVPTIGSKPSTGFTLGAAASLAMYFGDPATTRISSGLLGLSFSTKQQTSLIGRFGAYTGGDRMRVDGDNRFQWTSQDTYAPGTSSDSSTGVNARFTYVRVFETGYYKVRKDLFAGIGVHLSSHSDIRPGEGADASWESSPYIEYTRQHGFDESGQNSAGASLNVLMDTRDNHINASRGWLASVSYRPFFKDVLGGDSAWQEVLFDVRTFVPIRKDGRQKVAFWLYGDLVAHGVAPYFDLPTLGMDTYGRSGRGYSEGRFRGDGLVYGEVEYRATLLKNGLLGMVAFLNTTTLSDLDGGEELFESFASGGGLGFRLLFNKRSRTNLCLDLAWGRDGAKGLYLGLQEVF